MTTENDDNNYSGKEKMDKQDNLSSQSCDLVSSFKRNAKSELGPKSAYRQGDSKVDDDPEPTNAYVEAKQDSRLSGLIGPTTFLEDEKSPSEKQIKRGPLWDLIGN